MPLPREKRHTLADALTWDESERMELIYGEPVMMAPPVRRHQETLMKLSAQLHAYLKGKKCKVYPATFAARLFERNGDYPAVLRLVYGMANVMYTPVRPEHNPEI